jgi:hypothetical protein
MLDVSVHITQGTSIWEAVAATGTVAVAIATFLAVLVALFGRDLWERRHRPVLTIDYGPGEPYCRDTILEPGNVKAHWVRVRIVNRGGTAKGCRGKLIAVCEADGSARNDRDPMLLRWAGMPKNQELRPLDLARDDSHFLAVVVATDDNKEVATICTDPNARPGFPQTLEAGQLHRVRLGVYCDNGEPATADFKVTFSGDVHSLSMRQV